MKKKAYISPAALPYGMETEELLALSVINETIEQEEDGGWVKSEGRTYRNAVDWDDDWSE